MSVAASLVACSGGDETAGTGAAGGGGGESLDAHVCEHLEGGPFQAVTATDDAATAPDVSGDHVAYRIALPELAGETGGTGGAGGAMGSGQGGSGAYGGLVRLPVAEAGDTVLFFDFDVAVEVRDASGTPVPIEESCDPQSCSADCALLHGRHVVELDVGTYVLSLGPTVTPLVTFAHENAAHHHE